MKNKEKALNKIEQVKGSVMNLKSSAYGNRIPELTAKFERLDLLLEELEGLISIENGSFTNNRYSGI